MSANLNVPKLAFVIDTNLYSGNFEREMCAYITGQIGECGVGEEQSETFYSEVKDKNALDFFEEYIDSVADDSGCYRPASIWKTPNRVNDGNGKHFNEDEYYLARPPFPAYESVAIFLLEKPEQKIIDLMKNRAHKFCGIDTKFMKKNGIKIVGFRLIEMQVVSKEISI